MPAPLKPIQLAGALPRDPEFRAFVSQYMVPPREATAHDAAAFIRAACEIQSRRELETNPAAVDRLNRFIRRPFVAWKERQHAIA
ncbi:hypothetical protein [Paraburkholderia caribensis]|uniref:hypothetical protein n=1 Tax=Paraburkholderia caribensis TaxID=75105 RepID=UPI001D063E86|nr:hypothetical protein [Paraburkholderia caribensis]